MNHGSFDADELVSKVAAIPAKIATTIAIAAIQSALVFGAPIYFNVILSLLNKHRHLKRFDECFSVFS